MFSWEDMRWQARNLGKNRPRDSLRGCSCSCRSVRGLRLLSISPKGLQMVDRSPHFLSSPVASLDAQSVDLRPSCEACAVLSLYTISPWCNDSLYRNS